MTTTTKRKIDAVDYSIAQVIELDELREKLAELLQVVFPCDDLEDHIGTAMMFYRFGIQSELADRLDDYIHIHGLKSRSADEFFKEHCPYSIGAEPTKGKGSR